MVPLFPPSLHIYNLTIAYVAVDGNGARVIVFIRPNHEMALLAVDLGLLLLGLVLANGLAHSYLGLSVLVVLLIGWLAVLLGCVARLNWHAVLARVGL